ncbi:hypothetical protein BDZ91DRAFT_249431 [Kalaharituber pfeilii]|nr:hypothetical protein BDZ91DRAFT_249431 [Kalaharituber pfeilii]
MADVASVSRGGTNKESCPHGKTAAPTAAAPLDSHTNGDVPASEPPSSNATPPPPAPPPNSNSNVNTTMPANKKGASTAKKKHLDPTEVNNLLTAKISQLESDASLEEEEEKQIGAPGLFGAEMPPSSPKGQQRPSRACQFSGRQPCKS